MPPRFSLQSILDYHHNRVEILEVELGTMLHNRHGIMDLLMNLMKDQESSIENLKELQSGELDLHSIGLIRSNIRHLQDNIEKQQKSLKALEQAIEKKHLEVVQAKQDEAIYDKLKEKEFMRFQDKLNEQEKILMDDINTSKARKKAKDELEKNS